MTSEYNELKSLFSDENKCKKLTVFYESSISSPTLLDSHTIARHMLLFKKHHIGRVIPVLCNNVTELSFQEISKIVSFYGALLHEAQKHGISVAFNLEKAFEYAAVCDAEDTCDFDIGSYSLDKHSYSCRGGEDVKITIQTEKLMAIVAIDKDSYSTIDLRDNIKDKVLSWKSPEWKNWDIEIFYCEKPQKRSVNYLNFEASRKYIDAFLEPFMPVLKEYLGNTLDTVYMSEICFDAHNRRNWAPDINTFFEARFGFDPAPYYSAIFGNAGDDTYRLKSLFSDCRSAMLRAGIYAAVKGFCAAHSLSHIICMTEPKLPACPWITGDALLNNAESPCALLEKAYMYGLSSVRFAVAGAEHAEIDEIPFEIFKNYRSINQNIITREIFGAFAQGGNTVLAHIPKISSSSAAINDGYSLYSNQLQDTDIFNFDSGVASLSSMIQFVLRTQTVLSRGKRCADIAMVYPIQTLGSRFNLYSDSSTNFEYPYTPIKTDYMTLFDSISMYSAHNLSILHPNKISDARISQGKLTVNGQSFSVVVIPYTNLIALPVAEKIAEFFRAGGKIIVTGTCPRHAFGQRCKSDDDARVCELMDEIFGSSEERFMRDYIYNSNAQGGEAYLLYFTATAADGTHMVHSNTIKNTLDSFGVSWDIIMPGFPRFESLSAPNMPYNEFSRFGLDKVVPRGGILSYIHKKYGDTDIYFFSNTSDNPYGSDIFLKGRLSLEEWDAFSGKISPVPCKYYSYKDDIYTMTFLDIKPATAKLLVASNKICHCDITDAEIRPLPHIYQMS